MQPIGLSPLALDFPALARALALALLAPALLAAFAPLRAQQAAGAMGAREARAALEALDARISLPLLALPGRGADLRYFIEQKEQKEQKGQGGRTTVFWIANKGGEPVHFAPVWVMQGGLPWVPPEGGPGALPGRVHLSPGARMFLRPPEGFLRLELEEVRIGHDAGPFAETAHGGRQ